MHLVFSTVFALSLLQPGDGSGGAQAEQPASPPKVVGAEVSDPIALGGAWVRKKAIAFQHDAAGQGFDDLAGLDVIIGDARVVSLGEPTHGTKEAFQFKHRLLEYLVEIKGFSLFSIEANMPESFALNEYVIHGRGDPKKLIGGMYFWTWNTMEVLALVEWMRAWNVKNPEAEGKPRLRFTGFDMQTPDVAWKIGQDFLLDHAPELAERFRGVLKDVQTLGARAQVGSTSGGFTSATGSFPVEAAAGKSVRLSAWIRTEGVTGWAGAWWRCDTPTGVNGFNNMNDKNITGDTEWTRHEFVIDVPKNTEGIAFGFLLNGGGTAWFDDVQIELDGVKYENPELFSFDFENDAVRFLSGGSGEYSITRSTTKPYGGNKCLEIRRKPASELPPVDAAAIVASIDGILAELLIRRDELAKNASELETDWAIQNVRVVRQCANMYASSNGFNARDESMAANVLWILDQHPGEKIVLWAHNGHVTRDAASGIRPMGSHLSKALGTSMVAFGFVTGEGTYTAIPQGGGTLRSDHVLSKPPARSVEAVFLASELPRAVLDIRGAKSDHPGSAWATSRRPIRSIGALAMAQQFTPMVPRKAFDVLVWQQKTSASVPIGERKD
ncbi:MAG: erythromycin esterase family protein [Phycisphaerales bacterium]|nr:erythromycin esterase family protein [Phycisphaerales bacterium]